MRCRCSSTASPAGRSVTGCCATGWPAHPRTLPAGRVAAGRACRRSPRRRAAHHGPGRRRAAGGSGPAGPRRTAAGPGRGCGAVRRGTADRHRRRRLRDATGPTLLAGDLLPAGAETADPGLGRGCWRWPRRPGEPWRAVTVGRGARARAVPGHPRPDTPAARPESCWASWSRCARRADASRCRCPPSPGTPTRGPGGGGADARRGGRGRPCGSGPVAAPAAERSTTPTAGGVAAAGPEVLLGPPGPAGGETTRFGALALRACGRRCCWPRTWSGCERS